MTAISCLWSLNWIHVLTISQSEATVRNFFLHLELYFLLIGRQDPKIRSLSSSMLFLSLFSRCYKLVWGVVIYFFWPWSCLGSSGQIFCLCWYNEDYSLTCLSCYLSIDCFPSSQLQLRALFCGPFMLIVAIAWCHGQRSGDTHLRWNAVFARIGYLGSAFSLSKDCGHCAASHFILLGVEKNQSAFHLCLQFWWISKRLYFTPHQPYWTFHLFTHDSPEAIPIGPRSKN